MSNTFTGYISWICGRCSTVNRGNAAICTNPNCGGEPVSRTVEAISPSHRGDRKYHS